MKPLIGVVALCLWLAPATGYAENRWRLDPDHTTVMFEAPHIGYARIFGFFQRVQGELIFDETTRSLTSLRVKVDVDSVFTNDVKRDRHLRSADFLDANSHPVAEFVMTDADPMSDRTGQIIGDLTLRGVTRQVTLDVTLNRIGPYPFGTNYVLGASLTTIIKRSDFGSTYALQEGWIPDEIPVRIEVEAIREEPAP
ncbi:MAG TPA: YceI family protein [Geminicoccus sp.]|jgi:polyisoprenoid-binding protein YceI|uniref:YceI family protein n=1 Tax=Geminicoccus sp. TaxID=2024832 RepID=UPI002E351EA3|nr:YceI family protein [Geminicoccus sp.]HEX2526307.1 YceI family protein [Geminicoccus sp.]